MTEKEQEETNAISSKIRQALQELGMTQEEFAAKVGLSQSLVNHWLAGRRKPTFLGMQKITEVLNKPWDYFTSKISQQTEEFVRENAYDTSLIPIKGTSSASNVKFIVEETEAYLPIKKTNRDQFAIRVEGDCMVDPDDPANSIFPGSYVIVDPQARVEEEDVVLARISEEYSTIKRFYLNKDDKTIVELIPDNPKYKPFIKKLRDIEIVGKVVHIEKPSRKKRKRAI